jgi:alpha-galactosidase
MSIRINQAGRRFSLLGRRSVYAFEVDPDGALVHLAWGPAPQGVDTGSGLSDGLRRDVSDIVWDFETRPDEVVTYGDVTTHEVTLKVNFPEPARPLLAGEAAHLPVRDMRLRYVRHALTPDAQPGYAPVHGLPVRQREARETLCVTLRDAAYPLVVNLFYRLTPEHDLVERWCELVNEGATTLQVEACGAATVHLPAGCCELTHVDGAWAREFTPRRDRLPIGLTVLENRGLQTGHNHNPFFLLNQPGQAWEETGAVYFGALAYSGNWRLAIEQLNSLPVRVHAGYHPHDFTLTLKPGQRHATPALVLGVSGEGWGGASRRLHRFVRERVLVNKPEQPFRPVLYNSWEASYFDLSYEGQIELARRAAAIGVELFCVDDGWFGARRHERAGLGDWSVSADVFPRGLEPLVAEVRQLGMQFGLWVEPEMVNPDSDLYRAHPDWVLHFPGRPRTERRSQLILDFGRPEVVEHIFGVLDALVARYQIDFFKWDMNRYPAEPGSVVGREIWMRHVAGVYGIMDRLRQRHPRLSIQSCSGGGGRIDLGMLGRVDQVWTSDNTCAYDRLRIQEGYSLVYPPRAMECWVTHEWNHQTQVMATLALRFDVAMRGALGIGSNLRDLKEAELEDYRRYIAFYKRIRPVIQDGDVYRLERLEQFGRSIWLYVTPDARTAVYALAVRETMVGLMPPHPSLRGLQPDAVYRVTNLDGQDVARATGLDLMVQGLPLDRSSDRGQPRGYSRTLLLEQVDAK